MNKIKICKQLTETECGLCCISMVLSFYKILEPLNYFRDMITIGRDGTTVPSLIKILNKEGFSTSTHSILDFNIKTKRPVIIFSEKNNHFAVLQYIRNKLYIFDPAVGKYSINTEILKKEYSYVVDCIPENIIPRKGIINPWVNFLPLIFNNKNKLILIGFLSSIIYILSTSLTYVIQKNIDYISRGVLHKSLSLILFPVAVTICYFLFSYLRNKILVNLEVVLDRELNQNVFTRILKMPFTFFGSRSESELLYRLTLIQSIRSIISNGLVNLILDGGMLVFLGIYVLYLNLSYFVVLCVITFIILIYIFYINKILLNSNQKVIESQSHILESEIELLSMIEYIKATANEHFLLNKFKNRLTNNLKNFKDNENVSFFNSLVLDTLSLMIPFILFSFSLFFDITAKNTLGEKITLYMISTMIIGKETSLFQNITNIELMKNILYRINDIFDSKEEDLNLQGVSISKIETIEFENVSFSYSDVSETVLNNLSFSIFSHQKIAFVGPTGSGKSTIYKILTGLFTNYSGNVLINGVDFRDININNLRNQISTVPQNTTLLNDTIKTNITLGKKYSEQVMSKVLSLSLLDEDISGLPLGLNTKVSNISNNLSGGQKQRILIARAILNKKPIVFLDESTSSLDYITENQIIKNIINISDMQIIVAHRLSTITESDKIFYLEKGKILEQGTHEELMEIKGLYYNMYSKQNSNS